MEILRMVPENWMLREQREKLGLSQEEVATKAGIKLEQYQRYEMNDVCISSSSLRIVHAVLKALELDTTAFKQGEYALKPCRKTIPSISFVRNCDAGRDEYDYPNGP